MAFTPFHNVNCPHGFILSTAAVSPAAAAGKIPATAAVGDSIRVCQLPGRVRLDTAWVSQKVPTKGTPYKIAWHSQVSVVGGCAVTHVGTSTVLALATFLVLLLSLPPLLVLAVAGKEAVS